MGQVVVRSWMSGDGYEYEGKIYPLGTESINELRELVTNDTEFVAGRNTFTGEFVSEKFVAQMRERLLNG